MPRQVERLLWLVLPVLAALPLLCSSLPPLTDLPAHIGRFAVQLGYGTDPGLKQWYSFAWALVPNLGVDILVQVLGPVFGLERSVHWIVTTIPVLHVLGTLLLSKVVHGRITSTAVLATPLAYGLVLNFGFVNYALSIGLALIGAAVWIWLGRKGRPVLRAILFVPAGSVLWVCHLAGWAVFCVIAGCDAFTAARARGHPLLPAAARAALTMMPLAAGPLAGIMASPSGDGGAIVFSSLTSKVYWLKTVIWDAWPWWDLASAGVLVTLTAWVWSSHRFSLDRGLALAGAALVLLYVVLPFGMGGSFYADMRLAPVMLTLLLVAARPVEDTSERLVILMMAGALTFAGARFVGNALSYRQWDAKFAQTLTLLDHVAPNSQLVTLFVVGCEPDDPPNSERRAHFGGYAMERRQAFDNVQFIQAGAQLLSVHNRAAGEFENMSGNGTTLNPCGDRPVLREVVQRIPPAMDSLWVIGVKPDMRLPGWSRTAYAGDAVLYRRGQSDR